MNLATARAALTTWLTELTQLPVAWATRPRAWHGKSWILLRFSSLRSNGQDVLSYAEQDEDTLIPTVSGLRVLDLEIQVWSHGTGDEDDAIYVVEQIASDIHQPDTIAALAEAGLGLYEIRSMSFPLRSVGDREVSLGVLDVAFHTTSEHTGSVVNAVHQVNITGEVDDHLLELELTDGS